jgi:hypothetical protein
MTTKMLIKAAAVAMLATGLSLIPTIALATAAGPTKSQLGALVSAESTVVALATHYEPGASWATQFKAAESAQAAALQVVDARLGSPVAPVAPVAPAAPSGQRIADFSGSGCAVDGGCGNGISTGSFHVGPGGWTIDYVYNCPTGSAVDIDVYNQLGTLKGKDSPGSSGLGAQVSGVLHNIDQGTFHFGVVDYDCTWSVEVLTGTVGTAGVS